MNRPERSLLSVAGFDPTAGAGVLLDVGVFNRFGFHGASVLTSVTAQNTAGVREVRVLPSAFIQGQFDALADDLRIAGVKFGMLGGAGSVGVMKNILECLKDVPRVVDPVFRSSSGYALLPEGSIPAFLAAVRGRASLLTPNLDEAERITGLKPRDLNGLRTAARRIREMTGVPCLLKGGHLAGRPVDVLDDGRRCSVFRHPKIRGEVHGTGCFLSATILALLARGMPLEKACRRAVDATVDALASAADVGRGRRVFRTISRTKARRR
jgi:hydroxymethylpyrimidine kinase/phosphomethylpyrimidine kinase